MFSRFRLRHPGVSLCRVIWWCLWQGSLGLWMKACYRFRAVDAHLVPRQGAVLFVVNHQSYLDPIILASGCPYRQWYSMARSTLFDNFVFGRFIQSVNSIPVRQGQGDMTAMRRCIAVLKDQQALLVFPEGARCDDGVTHAFNPGMMLLVKRAKPTVVPVAIDGAYGVWKIHQKWPRAFGKIQIQFGKPISAQTLLEMPNGEALTHLHEMVEGMRLTLASASMVQNTTPDKSSG